MGEFVEYHKPCPSCGGSDPVSINEDGSGHCFSCNKHFRDYEGACNGETSTASPPVDIKQYRNNAMNHAEGEFIALTDRGISLESAKAFGVKAVKDYKGNIIKHLYPYYVANEIVGYKVREQNKMFTWKGSGQDSGLFGEQLWPSGGKYITLVEGVFDAVVAGANAIPILGSYIKEDGKLFQEIVNHGSDVYLALDPDAEKKTRRIIQKLLSYDVKVYKIDILPYTDVGEMSKEEFLHRKSKASFLNDENYLLYEAIKSL